MPEKLRISDVVRKYCVDAKILELHQSSKPEMPDHADDALSANGLDFAQKLVYAVNRLSVPKKKESKIGKRRDPFNWPLLYWFAMDTGRLVEALKQERNRDWIFAAWWKRLRITARNGAL